MSAVSHYAYLDTRVTILASRLLDAQTLVGLVDLPTDQAGALLGRAGLAVAVRASAGDVVSLEQALMVQWLSEAASLARATTGAGRELLLEWMRRFELINLKILLRGKRTQTDVHTLRQDLLDLGTAASLPVETLLRTETVGELLRALEATPYATMARVARALFEEQKDLFTLEAVLDRQYLVGLMQRVQRLPAAERTWLLPLVGTLADRNNLIWLLRYRFAYALTAPFVYFLLVPGGLRLHSARLRELVGKDSVEQVMSALPESLGISLASAKDMGQAEVSMCRVLHRKAQSTLSHARFNLARAVAYLVLREAQMLAVHVAVKGQWLKLDRELVRTCVLEASGDAQPVGEG